MPHRLALYFDFDNTLTEGDVLDELIERYSPNDTWRHWERAWAEGELSARDCLRLQIENMRVSREQLYAHVARVRIDPAFNDIMAWARQRRVPVSIVSDSFLPLIRQVLQTHGMDDVPIYANDLAFGDGDRLMPSFPFYDPAFPRSANAKARHLRASHGRRIVFAGDGHSDLDAALAADVVFAKSTLARELTALGIAFHPFHSLEPVLGFLETIGTLAALPAPHARLG
jgi:2,3-diketo-5-methylthio-1-phosphopentane phosphatase